MSLFAAPKCHHCVDTTLQVINNEEYPKLHWLKCYKCNECGIKHYQCFECMNKVMTQKKQVTDHKSYHQKKGKQTHQKDSIIKFT